MAEPPKRRRGRPRTEKAEDDSPVQALDRAILLLDRVAEADGMSLTEAANATGLPMSTTYRMLTTLQRRGMAEFDEATQLWHVGVETFRIGSAFLRRRKLVDRARAAMGDLVARCGETANLAVAEEDSLVFVGQVETHQTIRAFFRPGTRSPLHASGAGKAILSFRDAAQVAATVQRAGLPRFTPRTITTLPALLADLETARARGFAIDDEERNLCIIFFGDAMLIEL